MSANNLKNVNQPKDCEIFSSKRSEQEVLVLPPNLLQKLGINLRTIGNNSECLKIRDLGNDPDNLNGTQEKQKFNTNVEISINETKKGMAIVDTVKSIEKSVLPSPLPWRDNTLQDKKNNKKFTSKKFNTMENILDEKNKNHEVNPFKNNEGVFSCVNKNVNAFEENVDFVSKSSTYSIIESSKSKVNIISEQIISAEKLNNLKLHSTDKKSLIPFSINNPIDKFDSLKSISSSCNKFEHEYENNEKFDINNLNDSNSAICNENKMITSYSENISTNYPNECINQENELPSVSRLSGSENIKRKVIFREKETFVGSEDPSNYRENNNNFEDNKGTVCYNEKNCYNSETSTVLSQDHECANIADNKVKEIADYLCQYFLPAKANNSPKRFVTKPKICTEGVEKPGGMIKIDKYKYTKTYQNKKKNFKAQCNDALSNNFINNINAENLEIDDKVNDMYTHCVVEQLCVCKDFGKLQFYDNDCEYQHIHFLKQNTAQSSSDTLFEIYNSDCIKVSEENDNDKANNQYVDSDFNQYDSFEKNCFTNYLSNDNDTQKCDNSLLDEFEREKINDNEPKSIDIADFLSMSTDQNMMGINNITTKYELQIKDGKPSTSNLEAEVEVDEIYNNTLCGQKRKKLLQEETFWDDYDDNCPTISKYKKNQLIIKCAVCTEELSEDNWERHLANEHCYISWKAGHNIDLNDEKLLFKLTRRLKEVGVLKCTFCGTEKKFLKIFMKHVKICLKAATSDPDLREEKQDWKENSNSIVKCGICSKEMCASLWLDHIATEHNYQAWTSTEPPLDLNNQQQIQQHLQIIIKQTGKLVCARCGSTRKYAKSYMQHIETCDGNKVNCGLDEDSANEQMDNISTSSKVDNESLNALMYAGVVKCGVCHEKVNGEEWLDHIHKEHNYLARVEGVMPLDINDEEAVRNHFHRIRLITGYLSCAKCGLKRKFIKSFLQHIKSCGNISSLINNSRINEQTTINSSSDMTDEPVLNIIRNVKCGVCGLDVEGIKWLDHIHKKHNYLAWIEGKPPIDVNNKVEVWQYLNNLTKEIGGLVCVKCGLNRKYVKAYLEHINSCDGVLEDSLTYDDTLDVSHIEELICAGPVKCGVCAEEIDGKQWVEHIQNKHNYLAWREGNTPLNLVNNDEIINYLKILLIRIGGLSCSKCGLVIKVAKSYLQHVNNCDGSMERNNENSIQEADSEFIYTGKVKCGVCQEAVDGEQWINHIHKQHDYLARIEELPPVDVNDEKVVRRHLIRLKKYVKGFICNKCGQTCKLAKVYIRHLKYCDGREVGEGVELQDEDLSNDTNLSNPNSVCLLEDSNVYQKGNVKCGVCQAEMEGAVWLNHIQTEHNYLARVEGKPLLNIEDTEQVKLHLYSISKQIDGLVCSKCGGTRKYVKAFLQHIKNCEGKSYVVSESNSPSVTSEQTEEEIQLTFNGAVVCGVCKSEVEGDQWIEHIHKEHNYLAHVEGNTPLNLKDEKQIQRYLNVVCKYTGGLYCAKCGLMRMYVKSFLRHIRNCDSNMVPCYDINTLDQTNNSHEIDTINNTLDNSNDMSEFVYTGIAKCGVCQAEVEGDDWINHIQNEHNYLAWIDGKNHFDLDNIEQVHAHLYSLSKFNNGLICKTCGIKRKYVKSFLDHIDSCSSTINSSVIDGDNLMECAVCLEKVTPQDWKSHAMNNHYNIAWATGMEPIDLRNPYTVEKYLKEYKQANKSLVCKICKTSRVSCAGFYAHIITCGKTEEEIDFYKSYCDICNCKYLCIYKNQHLGMHREQEFIKVKKVKERMEKLCKDNTERKSTQGRRRAAERANTVLENYKTCMDKFHHKCSSCGFGTDLETELEDHSCETHSDRVSDSDVSVKFDGQSEEESADSDVDSNISMEEAEDRDNKKKRYIEFTAKVPRLLFKVNNASRYVSQGATDFIKMHYTLDVLFPQWITSEYQELDSKDLPKYLPILEESCKVKISNEGWTTYKRFEAKRNKVTSLFAGGSIRCVAWVPVRAESVWEARGESCDNYLAVASHAGPDAPRLAAAQHVAHRALVQLWHFADFTKLPKFVLGIAHDYGTVWAMDWCPSGVRDHQPNIEQTMSKKARLGLLAIACSNGSAYIFVVPYPNAGNLKNQQIIKIKPSAELRLCRGGERNKHQATAICWSQQKGHSVILVGYSDGTTAFYNFDCDSPLLKTIEDGVTIIYPFQDDRPHNTCISDVGLFPSYGESGCGWGAWSGASCTGAHAALCASAPRLHAPLATAHATFTPHWPSVIVTADEAIANHTTNELEWHGGGRRLGGQRALATCLRCGLGVAYVPPVLRVTRTHPAYRDQRRDIIGFIHMAPIAKKRSKHVNDELSMKVEPLIYEDAIKEYGLEFKLKIHMDKDDNNIMFRESKQHFPERFPLADVTSMSFCTSPSSHAKLAVATHAGLIFIINI